MELCLNAFPLVSFRQFWAWVKWLFQHGMECRKCLVFSQISKILGLQNTVVEQLIVISKLFVRLAHLSSTFVSASREAASQAESYNKLPENLQRRIVFSRTENGGENPLILSNNTCDQTYRHMKGSRSTTMCLQNLFVAKSHQVCSYCTSSLGYLFTKLRCCVIDMRFLDALAT